MPTETTTIDMTGCPCCETPPTDCECEEPNPLLTVSVTGACIEAAFPASFENPDDPVQEAPWESAELEALGVPGCGFTIVNASIQCISGQYVLDIDIECTDPDTGDPMSNSYNAPLTIESCEPVLWTASAVPISGAGNCGDFFDLGPIDIEVTE